MDRDTAEDFIRDYARRLEIDKALMRAVAVRSDWAILRNNVLERLWWLRQRDVAEARADELWRTTDFGRIEFIQRRHQDEDKVAMEELTEEVNEFMAALVIETDRDRGDYKHRFRMSVWEAGWFEVEEANSAAVWHQEEYVIEYFVSDFIVTQMHSLAWWKDEQGRILGDAIAKLFGMVKAIAIVDLLIGSARGHTWGEAPENHRTNTYDWEQER